MYRKHTKKQLHIRNWDYLFKPKSFYFFPKKYWQHDTNEEISGEKYPHQRPKTPKYLKRVQKRRLGRWVINTARLLQSQTRNHLQNLSSKLLIKEKSFWIQQQRKLLGARAVDVSKKARPVGRPIPLHPKSYYRNEFAAIANSIRLIDSGTKVRFRHVFNQFCLLGEKIGADKRNLKMEWVKANEELFGLKNKGYMADPSGRIERICNSKLRNSRYKLIMIDHYEERRTHGYIAEFVYSYLSSKLRHLMKRRGMQWVQARKWIPAWEINVEYDMQRVISYLKSKALRYAKLWGYLEPGFRLSCHLVPERVLSDYAYIWVGRLNNIIRTNNSTWRSFGLNQQKKWQEFVWSHWPEFKDIRKKDAFLNQQLMFYGKTDFGEKAFVTGDLRRLTLWQNLQNHKFIKEQLTGRKESPWVDFRLVAPRFAGKNKRDTEWNAAKNFDKKGGGGIVAKNSKIEQVHRLKFLTIYNTDGAFNLYAWLRNRMLYSSEAQIGLTKMFACKEMVGKLSPYVFNRPNHTRKVVSQRPCMHLMMTDRYLIDEMEDCFTRASVWTLPYNLKYEDLVWPLTSSILSFNHWFYRIIANTRDNINKQHNLVVRNISANQNLRIKH